MNQTTLYVYVFYYDLYQALAIGLYDCGNGPQGAMEIVTRTSSSNRQTLNSGENVLIQNNELAHPATVQWNGTTIDNVDGLRVTINNKPGLILLTHTFTESCSSLDKGLTIRTDSYAIMNIVLLFILIVFIIILFKGM